MTRLSAVAARIAIACASATLAVVSAQHDASRFDRVVEIARQELAETRTPGAAIALVQGDRMVFATGVGVADVEAGASVNPAMLFRLGSTTKMFTAAALLTLAENRKLSLDAPIGSIISGLDPAIARLTPNQLLSHTAGLRDEAPMFGRQDDAALGEGIRAMKTAAFFTEPGAIYSYSNPGFWIAGYVVEHVAGKPYADAMQEQLFTPLGMSRSTFRPMIAITYPLAQGHESAGGQPPAVIRPAANNTATWPAGSLFSNVHDLSRFVIAFMNQGRLDGRQVLAPSVIAMLSTAHSAIPGGQASYGYGLELSERRGIRLVSHGGSRAGYGSTILMAPERRAAAIVLGNRTGSGLPRTARRALEILLDVPPATLDPSSPTATDAAMTRREDLSAWVGRYSQGTGTPIEIALRDGRLVVREANREQPATPLGNLKLAVGPVDVVAPGSTAATWILIPDAAGRPAYVFRGGRAFKRVTSPSS
jgi:CubicO group peptidase (beta-lactamase class C family)